MKRRKEIITLALGIIAALVILIGQVNYYPVQSKAIQEVNQEPADETAHNEELKIFTNDAVSPAVTFNFNQILHFISNTYSETVEEVRSFVVENLTPIDYFETLFQRIISPNAP